MWLMSSAVTFLYGSSSLDKQVAVLALVNRLTSSSSVLVEVSKIVTQPPGAPGDLASFWYYSYFFKRRVGQDAKGG